MVLTLTFFLYALFLIFPSKSFAANRYWVGSTDGANITDTANWSTTQGACGVGGGASLPGSADVAIFTSSCTNGVTMNVSMNFQGMNIQSGYTGTFTQAADRILLLGSAGFTQADGTFVGSNGAITSASTFTLSGGTFTSTSGTLSITTHLTVTGGTFNHNNGNVNLTGSSTTAIWSCNNITFNTVSITKNGHGATIGSNCTLPIAGTNPTITIGTGNDNFTNNGTINITGNLTFTGGQYTNNTGGVLNMSGTSASFSEILTLNGGTFPVGLTTLTVGGTLNNTGNVLPDNIDLILNSGDNATLTCGNVDFNSVTISKNGNGLTVSNDCTLPIAGTNPTISVGGNTGDTLTNNGVLNVTGNLTFTGGTFNQNTGGTLNMTGTTATFSRNLTLTGGTFPAGITDLSVGGSLSNTGNLLPNNLNLTLNAGHASTINCGNATFSSVTINKSNGGATLNIGNTCNIPVAGTDPSTTGAIVNSGTINITGNWTHTGNYTANNGSTLSLSGTSLTINGSLLLAGGTFPQNITNLIIGGSLTNSNTLPNNLIVTINGGTNATWNCGSVTFNSVTISRTADNDNVTFASNCTIPLAGTNPTSVGVVTNNGTINVTGNWTLDGTYISNTGAVLSMTGNTLTVDALTLSGGTIDSDISSLNIGYHLTNTANILHSGIDLTLVSGADGNINCGNAVFNSFTVAKTSDRHDVTFISNCSTGDFTFTEGSIANPSASYTFNVTGNISITTANLFGGSNLNFKLNGTTDQTISQTNGAFTPHFEIDKSSGEAILSTNIGTSNTCDITNGTLSLNGYNFTCGSAFTVNAGSILKLNGNELTTTPTLQTDSIVQYVGDGDSISDEFRIKDWQYKNLEIAFIDSQDILTNEYSVDLTSGLQGYWEMDEESGTNLLDSSGNGNTGVATGTSIISGINGNARNFNGTASDFITINNAPNLEFGSPLTISAWVKTSVTGWKWIMGRSGWNYGLGINGSGYLAWTINSGNDRVSTGHISDGQWHHVTATHDGTTLKLYKDGIQVGSWTGVTLTSSTSVMYLGRYASGTNENWSGGIDEMRVYNRVINDTEISALATNTSSAIEEISVDENLNLISGTFSPPLDLNIGGDFSVMGGTFSHNDGTITLNGTNQSISGDITFYNLTKNVSAPRTLTFEAGSTQTITNTLTLNGTAENLLSLRSSEDGTQWNIDPQGTRTISYVDVKDSNNINETGIDTNGFHITDSGNNTNWVVDVTLPEFTLTAITPDPGIDSTPLLSGSVADEFGTISDVEFQVDSTSGSWTDCSADDGQFDEATEAFGCQIVSAVSDGNHTINVRATDNYGNISLNAASSRDTFIIDTTAPSNPGAPTTTSPTNDNTPTWTWATSTDSGTGLATDAYTIEWSQDSEFLADVFTSSSNTNSYTHISALSDGTWYFRVKAKDQVENTTSFTANGSTVIDASFPTTPGIPSTASPTLDSTPTWTWTASTDAGSGLAAIPYTIQWSTDSSFIANVSSTTVNTNAYTHSAQLADGTWYFRVKAKDSLNNESAYSSNGNVVIDTTAPTIPGTPAIATTSNDSTPTWDWTASTDAGVGLSNPAYTIQWSQDSGFLSAVSTSTTNTNTFTHTIQLNDGTWYFRVKAKDNLNTESNYSSFGTATIDTTAPSISNLEITTENNSATITWITDIEASTLIEYGLDNQYGQSTSETDTSPRVTNHTVSINGLIACTTYHFRARSSDGDSNEGMTGDNTFTTSGCTASAEIEAQTANEILTGTGGTISLLENSVGITLNIPSSFSESDSVFQIHKLNRNTVIEAISSPLPNLVVVGSYMYELKALTDINTILNSFDNPIEITFIYSESDVTLIEEENIKIYRWDGSDWNELDNCVIDISANTITCETTEFSTFTIFGTQTPEPARPRGAAGGTQGRTFKDINGLPVENYVLSLYNSGVIDGYNDGTYRPESYITRAELAKIIVNAFELTAEVEVERFPDVSEDHSLYRYIYTLKQLNVIGGYPDGTFRPNKFITRAEATKIITRTIQLKGIPVFYGKESKFPDVNKNHTLFNYISFLSETEIINGYSDGTFKPDVFLTRGQMAKIVYNSQRLR